MVRLDEKGLLVNRWMDWEGKVDEMAEQILLLLV